MCAQTLTQTSAWLRGRPQFARCQSSKKMGNLQEDTVFQGLSWPVVPGLLDFQPQKRKNILPKWKDVQFQYWDTYSNGWFDAYYIHVYIYIYTRKNDIMMISDDYIFAGARSHRDSPSHHPFIDGIFHWNHPATLGDPMEIGIWIPHFPLSTYEILIDVEVWQSGNGITGIHRENSLDSAMNISRWPTNQGKPLPAVDLSWISTCGIRPVKNDHLKLKKCKSSHNT